MAEALGHGRGRQRPQLTEGADAEAIQHVRQPGELGTRPEQPDRQGREEGANRPARDRDRAAPTHHHPPSHGPPRPGTHGGGVGAEPAGRAAQPGAPPHHPARGGEHSVEPPAVDSGQAVCVEVRDPRRVRLAGRPDPLQPVEHLAPRRAHPVGIGRHEPQLWAARECLSNPHPGDDAECLGRGRDLPHDLASARFRSERDCSSHELAAGVLGVTPSIPAAKRGEEREAGIEHADDHKRTYVRTSGRRPDP